MMIENEEEEEDEINNNLEFYPINPKFKNTQNIIRNRFRTYFYLGFIILFLVFLFIAVFYWIENKSQQHEYTSLLPFQDPDNENRLKCPINTSFDSTTFTCLKCSSNCIACQHEFEQICLQCSLPFKLKQNICVKECTSVNNICVNTTNLKVDQINYTVIDLGSTLKINTLFQVEIHNYSSKNIYILFPPLGSSFNYFYESVQLPDLARKLESIIFVFSTPYTEVLQIQETKDQSKSEFAYVNRVYKFISSYIQNQTKSINIVGLGDMFFFAHKFATYIARSIDKNLKLNLILMQISKIQLQESIQLEEQKLQNLFNVINYEKNFTHQDQEDNQQNQNITQQIQNLKQNMNIKKLNSVNNKRINVVVISERHCKDVSSVYQNGFNQQNFTQIFVDNNKWQALFSKLQGLLLR